MCTLHSKEKADKCKLTGWGLNGWKRLAFYVTRAPVVILIKRVKIKNKKKHMRELIVHSKIYNMHFENRFSFYAD